MAASIKFYAGENADIAYLSGSGLGFYGSTGFGASVNVAEWQSRTFITNSNGTVQGPEVDNCKHYNATGVVLGQSGSGIKLNCIPNYLATLNIRFEYDTAVRTQNVKFLSYDRVATGSPGSGVTFAVYEVSHLTSGQSGNGSGGPGTPTISGSHGWYYFYATGATPLSLTASPGISGTRVSGSGTTESRHDWYLALSASPDSIGSKTWAGYLSLEYL